MSARAVLAGILKAVSFSTSLFPNFNTFLEPLYKNIETRRILPTVHKFIYYMKINAILPRGYTVGSYAY